jgi:2-desacetyl-2-hydroxyethyl bacteriochlorophyllide A dehydrogenase
MRAAVLEGAGQVAVRDVERLSPAAGEVLVRVAYCGICGTDLHTMLDGWGTPGSVGGHEWSGEVEAVGAGVTAWRPGDHVVGGPAPCGSCRWCRDGYPALCVADPIRTGTQGHGGAFAEYHLGPADGLRPVPAGLPLRAAALAEPLAVALHGLTVASSVGAEVTGRVLVTGAGPLGLLVVAALAARGAAEVVVSEPSAARRTQAMKAGASSAVAPDELPAAPELPTQCRDDGFDVAFDCSGQGAAIATCLSLLRPAGRLVLLGTGSMSVRFDPIRILLNELVVTGAYCYDDGGIEAALDLLASGRLPVDSLLMPDDVRLDGLIGALHGLKSGEIPAKVLVRP